MDSSTSMVSTQTDQPPAEMDCQRIPLAETGRFSKIVIDYVERSPKLKSAVNRWPDLHGLRDQIEERKGKPVDRKKLVEVLQNQYAGISKPPAQIDWLKEENTFTVTTGHQLNLFTGPLFFIYKIASAINLCEQLQEEYPDYKFVPVFWMASEDHDFQEINHAYVGNRKVEWESGQTGAVGRMTLEGINESLEELRQAMPKGFWSEEIFEVIGAAYREARSLSEATREVVHHLFGRYGLVILDADDPVLKSLFAKTMERELLDPFVESQMKRSADQLKDHYKLQVTPREINLFYLTDGFRDRIVKRGDEFEAINGGPTFTREEIGNELKDHPERFSPNVAMRPMYQEAILPNLAYVGGGGELAYWMQLKPAFDEAGIPYPVFVLRNSVMLCSSKARKRMEQLGLDWQELFNTPEMLEKMTVLRESTRDLTLREERRAIEEALDSAEAKLVDTESTLKGSVEAVKARAEKLITRLEKKWISAEKRNQDTSIDRLNEILSELFPEDQLQERHDNFLGEYAKRGQSFIEAVLLHIRPLEPNFCLLIER